MGRRGFATYLSTFSERLAAHLIEDMSANVRSHIYKNVILTTDQTRDLSIPLKTPDLVSRDEVADEEMFLV